MGAWLNELVARLGPWGLVVLGAAATVEYLFPPFPGDTVVVFGSWLAVTGELPWAAVWAVVTGTSALGMAADWAVGRWLGVHADRLPKEADRPWYHPLSQERLVRFQYRYQRWGGGLILANRFVPAVRAVFFVAAGASGLSLFRTVVLGLLSAGAWNALLLGAGYAVGRNLDALEVLVRRYTVAAWIGLGLLGVLFVVRLAWRRRRGARR